MNKIIINGKFLTQKTTGVQRYARELLNELDGYILKNEIFLAVPNYVKSIPFYKNIEVVKVGKGKGIYWEQVEFPLYVKKEKGISLNLCNVAPLISPGIVCIFDMKIKLFPQFFSWKFRLWYNLLFFNQTARAKIILTDSETAKYDIIRYYPKLRKDKIQVVYPAWQHYCRISYDEDSLKKYCLKRNNYFFAMGSMEPNKNFKWIAEVAKQNPNELFAIAGSINKKVFNEGIGFDCPNNMILLGYVSDEEAKTLMRDSKAFLFPSFCEGFGIPPLEAMSANCSQLIVSDIPVMHEIFGDSVYYINPNIAALNLEQLLNDNKSFSREILEKYSWEKSARKLLEILKAC